MCNSGIQIIEYQFLKSNVSVFQFLPLLEYAYAPLSPQQAKILVSFDHTIFFHAPITVISTHDVPSELYAILSVPAI